MSYTYKAARAHAGNLVHAVPVDDDGNTMNEALCGKDRRQSRKAVWLVFSQHREITCPRCLSNIRQKGFTQK